MLAITSIPYRKPWFFIVKTFFVTLYFSIVRTFIYTGINNLNNYITSTDINPNTDNTIVSFLKTHKTSVSFTCDTTSEILLPLADFYIIQSFAVNGVTLLFDIKKLNVFFENSKFIHLSPIFFRSTSILLELSDQCKKQEISTIKEIPIRASEFTAWYYLFNFYFQNKITNKAGLALTNKIFAIYSIRFSDQLEYKLLEQSSRPLISLQLFIPPLFKSPVTTICKIPVDIFLKSYLTKHALEVFCNFLGELSYNHAENHLKYNTSLLSFSTNTSYTTYLFTKSIWKTAHQNLEKHRTTTEALDKPLGYRAMAFFAPRNYITKKLKIFFDTKDSSDYLDPDLVELSDLKGINPVSIKSTDNLLLTAQTHGMCLSSPRIENKILNITNNLWGWGHNITTERKKNIILCTSIKFSENWENPYLNTQQPSDFAALNLATKTLLNTSAENCLVESLKEKNVTEQTLSLFSTTAYFWEITTSYLGSWFTLTDGL